MIFIDNVFDVTIEDKLIERWTRYGFLAVGLLWRCYYDFKLSYLNIKTVKG